MKKILSGLFGLFVALAAVGVGFALYFNEVTVSGMGLTMTDPTLQIAATTNGPFGENYDLPLGIITDLRPGDPARQFHFALKNMSGRDMKIIPFVIQPAIGWDEDVAFSVYVAFEPSTITSEDEVGWWTLQDWFLNGGQRWATGVLAANQTADYTFWVKIRDIPDRISAGKTISNVQFLLNGTW